MKALILAGGRGTRLRPLTHTKNKHSLPIGNKPMIERIIDDAIELGIKEIIINVNKGDTEMHELLGDGKRFGKDIKIHYIEQPEPNGMMYPIKLAQKLIGKEDFLFSAGDNILAGGLKKHYNDFKKKKSDAHVLVVRRPDYQNFGVAVLDEKGEKVINTVEKPQEFVSDLVLTGIYFFTPVVFDAFEDAKPIDPKGTGHPEFFPPVINNWLIKKGYTFTCSEVTGWWKDTGKHEDLILANRLILEKECKDIQKGNIVNSLIEGNVEIPNGVTVENSTLRGPISISQGSVIKDSYIGPFTSIGRDCIVEESHIENSVLMNEVKIHGVDKMLDGCLFGSNSEVTQEKKLPKADTLYIGDDSKLIFSK